MAHHITDSDTPVYVGRPAWHKLGTVIDVETAQSMTFRQAMTHANLLFDVQTFEVFARVLNPAYIVPQKGKKADPNVPEYIDVPVEGWAATVRLDEMRALSCVSDGYQVSPNEELADLFDAINEGAADGRVIDPEAMVSLDAGRRVVVTGKFRDGVVLPGGDKVQPYLFAATSHDRSMLTRVRTCMFRIECANMLRAGLAGTAQLDLAVPHTTNREQMMAAGKATLVDAVNDVRNFELRARALIDTPVDEATFGQLLDVVVQPRYRKNAPMTDRIRQQLETSKLAIRALWSGDPRVGDYKGTAWGALQAVSTFEQHHRPTDDVETRNVGEWQNNKFEMTNKAELFVADLVDGWKELATATA